MCLMPNENLENKSFKSLKYNMSDATEDILLDNSCDSDSNYFNTEIKSFDTPHVIPEEFHSQFKNHMSDGLSFFQNNIKSVNKNFENFKLFLSSLAFTFSVICFSETWLDETTISNKSLYELPNYTSIHQVRKQKRGGGVSLYIHQSIEFKIRNDLSIKSDDVESFSVDFLFENGKNTIFYVLYRQAEGQIELFEKILKEKFSQIRSSNKQFHNAGDFNLNVLRYEICKKIQEFLNIIYGNGMIPIINKYLGNY